MHLHLLLTYFILSCSHTSHTDSTLEAQESHLALGKEVQTLYYGMSKERKSGGYGGLKWWKWNIWLPVSVIVRSDAHRQKRRRKEGEGQTDGATLSTTTEEEEEDGAGEWHAGVLWGWSVLLISSDKWQAAEQAGRTSVANTHTGCSHAPMPLPPLYLLLQSLFDRQIAVALLWFGLRVFRMNTLPLEWL